MARPPAARAPRPAGPALIQGERPAVSSAARPVLNLDESAMFTWILNPFRLDVYLTPKGPKVLPVPLPVPHAGGINRAAENMAARGKVAGALPQGDPAGALAYYAREGWIAVPHDFEVITYVGTGGRQRKLVREPGYVRAFQTRQGWAHLPIWSRPYQAGNQVLFEHDHQGRWESLDLMRRDLIGDLDPNALMSLREHLLDCYRRVRAKKHGFGPEERRIYKAKLQAFTEFDLDPIDFDADTDEDGETDDTPNQDAAAS